MDALRLGTDSRQAGVSLIDALVALAILAFTIVGLSALNSTTLENNRLSRRLTEGLHLAQSKLEEFRALDYASIVPGGDGPLTPTGATSGSGAIYTRRWSVVEAPPASGIKRISVHVSWPEKGDTGGFVLHTLAVDR